MAMSVRPGSGARAAGRVAPLTVKLKSPTVAITAP